MVVLTSFPDDLRAYLASRLLTGPMLGLLLLLLTAIWFPGFPDDVTTASLQVLLTVNLITMFRLWDDLADLPTDRTSKADRVLCRTSHETQFRWTCMCLGMTALGMLMLMAPLHGVGFVCLSAAFLAYYRSSWRRVWQRVSYHLLICKYPCILALVSYHQDGSLKPTQILLFSLTYLVLCIYEVVHDPERRADLWCRMIAACECLAACVIVACLAIDFP